MNRLTKRWNSSLKVASKDKNFLVIQKPLKTFNALGVLYLIVFNEWHGLNPDSYIYKIKLIHMLSADLLTIWPNSQVLAGNP